MDSPYPRQVLADATDEQLLRAPRAITNLARSILSEATGTVQISLPFVVFWKDHRHYIVYCHIALLFSNVSAKILLFDRPQRTENSPTAAIREAANKLLNTKKMYYLKEIVLFLTPKNHRLQAENPSRLLLKEQ
jgi:hypothetical protein